MGNAHVASDPAHSPVIPSGAKRRKIPPSKAGARQSWGYSPRRFGRTMVNSVDEMVE